MYKSNVYVKEQILVCVFKHFGYSYMQIQVRTVWVYKSDK